MGNFEGDGFEVIRPRPTWNRGSEVNIADLVPDADWFWYSLQRHCVPGCCGLAAYDFSRDSVQWAAGFGTVRPTTNDWRDPNPGDARDLAARLREAACEVRRVEAEAVDGGELFDEILTPESYALLFEDLAEKLDPPVSEVQKSSDCPR